MILTYSYLPNVKASDKDQYGLLLVVRSSEDKYKTVFLEIKHSKIKTVKEYPFIIYPEKTISESQKEYLNTLNEDEANEASYYDDVTGNLKYICKDIIKNSWNGFESKFIIFWNLDSAINFKDTFLVEEKPTIRELIENETDSVSEEDVAWMLNTYENYTYEIDYLLFPYITFTYSGGYNGGAHPNWFSCQKTEYFDAFSDSTYSIEYHNTYNYFDFNHEINLNCCKREDYDSLFQLLQFQADSGNFIDGFDQDYSNSGYKIRMDDIYEILEEINGEPHWILRGNADASYAQSGDYSLTTEIDVGVINNSYKKKGNYEILSPDGKYGLVIDGQNLKVYNNSKLIYEYSIGKGYYVIGEEWALNNKIEIWKNTLK